MKYSRDEFERLAVEHTVALAKGMVYKKTNAIHGKLMKMISSLKQGGKLTELTELLANEETGVRLWAASGLLGSKDELAIPVLELISNDKTSPHRLTAFGLIDLWKSGHFDNNT